MFLLGNKNSDQSDFFSILQVDLYIIPLLKNTFVIEETVKGIRNFCLKWNEKRLLKQQTKLELQSPIYNLIWTCFGVKKRKMSAVAEINHSHESVDNVC